MSAELNQDLDNQMGDQPIAQRGRPRCLNSSEILGELFAITSEDEDDSDCLGALVDEHENEEESQDDENSFYEEVYSAEHNVEDVEEDCDEELHDQVNVACNHSTPSIDQRRVWRVADSDENPDQEEDRLEHPTNQRVIYDSDEDRMSTESNQDLVDRREIMMDSDDSVNDPTYLYEMPQAQTRGTRPRGRPRGRQGITTGRSRARDDSGDDSIILNQVDRAQTRGTRPRGRPRGRQQKTTGRGRGRDDSVDDPTFLDQVDCDEEVDQGQTTGKGKIKKVPLPPMYEKEWDDDYDEKPPKISPFGGPPHTQKELAEFHSKFFKYYPEPRADINIGKFSFEPKRPPGPDPIIFPRNRSYTELEVFEKFQTKEVLNMIAGNSNFYGREKHSQSEGNHEYKPITIIELRLFEQILFYMGVIKKPAIADYWSKDWFKGSSPCKDMLSRNRFQTILSYLIFTTERVIPENGDRLYRSRKLMNLLNVIYSENYYPYEGISIDESLVGYYGKRVGCIVNLMEKAKRVGFKLYKANCSKTGYTLHFKTYSNSLADSIYKIRIFLDYDISDFTDPARIVLYFILPYLGVGHTVATDSFYTDPRLFRVLLEEHTNCVGTVQNRKYMPARSRKRLLRNIKPDEIVQWYSRPICEDKCLLISAWSDKKIVKTISTFHNHTEKESLEVTEKRRKKRNNAELPNRPQYIVDYKKFMPGIDKSDQQMSYYNCQRMGIKRPHKLLYMNSLEMTCHNAYIVYTQLMDPTNKLPRYTYLDFKQRLFTQTCMKYKQNNYAMQTEQVMRHNTTEIDMIRYNTSLRHIPIKCANSIKVNGKKSHHTGSCAQCKYDCSAGHQDCDRYCPSRTRNRASFKCKTCDQFLHIGEDSGSNCFDNWHTPGIGRVNEPKRRKPVGAQVQVQQDEDMFMNADNDTIQPQGRSENDDMFDNDNAIDNDFDAQPQSQGALDMSDNWEDRTFGNSQDGENDGLHFSFNLESSRRRPNDY